MFTRGFVIGVPVVITFVDYVGSVKGVTGISMQVSFRSSFRDIKFTYSLTHISQNLSSENLFLYSEIEIFCVITFCLKMC